MILSLARRLGIKQQGLIYKLSVIKALLSILPLLILSYIFYENKTSLELPQVFLIPLSLVLILGGFVILRQIFDRVRMIATSIKQAEASGSGWIDTQQDTAELHQIAICFNSLMNKFELTTTELQQRVFELFAIKELIEVASMSIDLDALLNTLLEKAMAVSKAQIGSVYEVEPEGQRFRIVARRGLESGPKKGSYIDINESMAGPVVFAKRPL
ncbi:MAG: hypothetical protein HWN71_04955, partial [Desulfobacterales bacterium]|nr:hypothetical protein [Desulfobacterales bacterium]